MRYAPLLALLALAAVACDGPAVPAQPPTPIPNARSETVHLTEDDIRAYVAVRNRSLDRLEQALVAAERASSVAAANLLELQAAEREAAAGLGVDWSRYSAVRDEIARLMVMQRHDEDARLLALELRRAREDLEDQLKVARDLAGRQFLEAQLRTVNGELAKLERARVPAAADEIDIQLLETVRAELAVQQGRHERVQRRIRELIEKSRHEGSASAL